MNCAQEAEDEIEPPEDFDPVAQADGDSSLPKKAGAESTPRLDGDEPAECFVIGIRIARDWTAEADGGHQYTYLLNTNPSVSVQEQREGAAMAIQALRRFIEMHQPHVLGMVGH